MYRKLHLFALILGLSTSQLLAHSNSSIQGTVKDSSGHAVSGALVVVQTSCKNGALFFTTDSAGKFYMQGPSCPQTRVRCIVQGCDTLEMLLEQGADSIHNIHFLTCISGSLDGAKITAKTRSITVQGDKVIVDATAISPGAIASVLDLLLRCPGVLVDEYNNSLSLKGRSGVMIMIEDRLQPLSGETLFNWLRSTPASAISKIELISNPSSRYDAAGTAGFINFKMKKNSHEGISGNLSGGAGQGRYGKLSAGGTLNYKKNGTQLSSQYNYALRNSFNQLHLQRDFYQNDSFTGSYKQRNYLRFPIDVHTLRLGLDKQFSRGWTAGSSVSGNLTTYQPNGKNYSDVLGGNGQVQSYFSTVNNSDENKSNAAANAYIRKTLDSLGSSFSTDIDAAAYWNISKQRFLTEYFDAQYVKNQSDYILTGNTQGLLTILALKSDYVYRSATGFTMETGVKFSTVQADNDVRFFNSSTGISFLDSGKSNHFIYTENIGAAYSQISGGNAQWQYQLGLRNETTFATGKQKTTGDGFNKNYSQWFPSAVINHVSNKGNNLSLSITRRIQRPGYNDLNPFKFYLDPSTYKAGNTNLNPEYSWSAEMGFATATGRSFTVSANQVNGIITEVLYPSENEPQTTIQTSLNLNSARTLVGSFSTPLTLGKRSQGYWSISAAYQQYKGNVAATALNKGSLAIVGTGSQNYTFNSNWTADVSAVYQSGQVYGFMYLKQLGQLGIGVQRQLLHKTAVVKLSLSDLFFTGSPRGESEFTNYRESFEVWRETRMAMLSFTWKFGSPQQGNRKRSGSAEEEKQRAQNAIG